jgi:hypothetical protein
VDRLKAYVIAAFFNGLADGLKRLAIYEVLLERGLKS